MSNLGISLQLGALASLVKLGKQIYDLVEKKNDGGSFVADEPPRFVVQFRWPSKPVTREIALEGIKVLKECYTEALPWWHAALASSYDTKSVALFNLLRTSATPGMTPSEEITLLESVYQGLLVFEDRIEQYAPKSTLSMEDYAWLQRPGGGSNFQQVVLSISPEGWPSEAWWQSLVGSKRTPIITSVGITFGTEGEGVWTWLAIALDAVLAEDVRGTKLKNLVKLAKDLGAPFAFVVIDVPKMILEALKVGGIVGGISFAGLTARDVVRGHRRRLLP